MSPRGRVNRPLAGAAERLRDVPGFPRHVGRPRKVESADKTGARNPNCAQARQASAPVSDPLFMRSPARGVPVMCPPRLLDLPATAAYLGVSPWTVRDLDAAGVLRRVRVPLPSGAELRKLLFDRADLDRLIEAWKDGPEAVQEGS